MHRISNIGDEELHIIEVQIGEYFGEDDIQRFDDIYDRKIKAMKFSIITVCFNSERTIKDTIDSVLEQTWVNFEIIVIDGKSEDTTCEIVQSYNDERIRLISEEDQGNLFRNE